MAKFILFIIIFIQSPYLHAEAPCNDIPKCKRKFYYNNSFLQYHSNFSILKKNNNIKQAIIVIHGTLRNGDEYYKSVMAASLLEGKQSESLIIAPSFKRIDDPKEKDELFWGRKWYQKWKYGYPSQNASPISSFKLIDELIFQVSNQSNFPNLKNIIIIGHSAGGQFIQRYAVGTTIDQNINHKLILVPSNPSSYLYLNENRYHFKNGNFHLMKEPSHNCSDYNQYIYGLENLPPYFSGFSKAELYKNFQKKNLIYL